ncbi:MULTISPECIES: hypothetical protein [unclassified Sedimentibacter]|uniref:prenylated flavin chaperone LpdD n=1 Tax=unclassified Sedimentibacter TaxID=2649220 RepID=UPI0027E04547|nr:hypothetical protein [Sedimentibacter sp. MB35-C1]WMJ78540.1 hypothetical protein RBQ61_06350 [Sedimentibacter sp. MB35-C1]
MLESCKLRAGAGKCVVEAMVVKCGRDINVAIGGGEKYHLGAAAVAVPRFDYKKEVKRTASTSVICVQGHREDELTYKAAKYLATALDCTVVAAMGIHIDNITEQEYCQVIDNVNKVLDNIVKKLQE